MSEETPVSEEQLFDSDDSEVADDDATDSNADSEETAEDEQEQDLDLEEVNKASTDKAEDNKFTQLEAFQKKVKAGDIKSPNDLPKAQKWMAKYLQFPSSESKPDKDSLKEELRQELREERKNEREAEAFDELYEQVNSKADPSQKGVINEHYKELRSEGVSKLKALELSAKYARLDFDGISQRKKAMRLPMPGKVKGRTADFSSMGFSDIAKKLSPKDQVKYLESLQ